MKKLITVALLALFAGSASAEDTKPTPLPKNDYADGANWLCLPGRADDACGRANEASTIVTPDGSLIPQTFARDDNAPIDCFYVYPTISLDQGVLSDMKPGIEEN